MRDKRFIAVHRGGPLTQEQHCRLIQWACACSKHVLRLSGDPVDQRLIGALRTADAWRKGIASVGDARKAAVAAHAAARASQDPVSAAVARSVGHAVAAAHMADHAPGSADYALKAVKLSGKSILRERKWQNDHLPDGIRTLVLSARKKRHLKL